MEGHRLPLEGVRVLALEQYGAGPYATSHLAELGAEVIKVEDPSQGGDIGRRIPPYAVGDTSLFFHTLNRGKSSISLDLRNPSGRKVFEQLVASSDAVFSNLRGDVPDKLGITYRHLEHINPRIVCCSLSAYGMTGPRRGEPGYDYIVQGLAGWMTLTGEPDEPPQKTGLSVVDWAAGLVAAGSLLAGLLEARRDGIGGDCDVALLDVAMSFLSYVATWHLTSGYEPGRSRHSAHPSLVPFQNFETADGWIVVACAKEKFWRQLLVAIDRTEWADDPRFRDFTARDRHRDELLPLLENVFRDDPTETWVHRLTEAGVPCGPVNTVAEAMHDPQVRARDLISETEHPELGRVRQIATPFRLGTRTEMSPAPALGADTDRVLARVAGYRVGELDRLRAAGAFGTTTASRPERAGSQGGVDGEPLDT